MSPPYCGVRTAFFANRGQIPHRHILYRYQGHKLTLQELLAQGANPDVRDRCGLILFAFALFLFSLLIMFIIEK
jgi:hypothetical protein